ncbi:DUF6205 family protein [Nocardiopsis synnemataformans]|uniref:DUF6205 family protein n=1 Tax=Nocardiopsis synnemataformans TaxID=61305 RepID=UPI003EBF342D
MGYGVTFDGEITVDPPLNWGQIRRSPASDDLEMVQDEKKTDTEEGQTLVISCARLRPQIEADGYRVELQLQALVDIFGAAHTFGGYIECWGEDQGDLTRLVVREGKVLRIKPTITWPQI